jgi:hypothetical protein
MIPSSILPSNMSNRIHFRNPPYEEHSALALSKAPDDVNRIIHGLGFEDLWLARQRKSVLGHQFSRLVRMIQSSFVPRRLAPGTVVFCQTLFPLSWSPANIAFLRNSRRRGAFVVTLFHDIDVARGRTLADTDGLSRDSRDFLVNSDVIISHNARMSAWLVNHGVPAGKIVDLGLFDYLADGFEPAPDKSFDHCVTIAGNLGLHKAGYLAELGDIHDVDWRLYGPMFDPGRTKGPTIHYCGCFPPDELPRHLTAGFGLVWDGSSIDTCAGGHGEYLRINNPHKLSLYLASGLPVIVWDGSAAADFVRANDAGFAVRSLREIGARLADISDSDYGRFKRNACAVSAKLRSGHFTKTALAKALALVDNTPPRP